MHDSDQRVGSFQSTSRLAGMIPAVLFTFCFANLSEAQSRATSRVPAGAPATTPSSIPGGGDVVDADSHPLIPALKIAGESREALDQVGDYTAVFLKRELIGKRYSSHTIDMKVRQEPFSVYLRFQQPHEGREVIYVAGANQGNLLVHEEGIKSLAGTLALAPTSEEAMRENRYPITRIGLHNLLDTIVNQWQQELKYGETDVRYFPNAKLGNVACRVIETSHPQPRRQFRFHMTRLYLSKETNLPVRVEQYGWPPSPGAQAPLHEMYTYTNLRTNVGLTDRDFDPHNPAYRF